MYLTIDELYAMKGKYLEEMQKLEAKLSAVDDFIAYASTKEPTVEEEVVETETEEAII